MKKSTGILLLLSFFVIALIMAGIFISLIIYAMQGNTPNILRSNRLALVRIEGVIYDVEDWIDEIKSYQEDSTIKGLVIRVNSPGGAIGPSQDLYDAIKETKEKYKKVIVCSFASVAASGGYYIACPADRIVSSPGTLTGSIGVYTKFLQLSGLFEKIGVDYETVKAGKYKDFGSMERKLTNEEREMMQGVIDDSYMQFIEAVYDGRKQPLSKLLTGLDLTETPQTYPFSSDVIDMVRSFQMDRQRFTEADRIAESIDAATDTAESEENTSRDASVEYLPDDDLLLELTKVLAEGKVYTGRQAKMVGLVDEVGTLDDAIRLCARLTGISGDPTLVEKKAQKMSIFDLLTQKLSMYTEQKVQSPIQYHYPY
jgi:protease IV